MFVSHKTDPEYRLLSEKRNPARKMPQVVVEKDTEYRLTDRVGNGSIT